MTRTIDDPNSAAPVADGDGRTADQRTSPTTIDPTAPPAPEQYDAVAEDYDRLIRPRYEAIATLVVERVHELTDLQGAVVVELSAGTGALTHQLAPLASTYVATDVSEPMMQVALARAVPGTEQVTWLRADVQDLRLESASADVVVSSLGVFQEFERGIDEALRVLRPGGLLVASTWGDDYRELELLQELRAGLGVDPRPTTSASELSVRLRQSGFREVVVREVRLPVVHPSVDDYIAYREAFGRAPDLAEVPGEDVLRALISCAEARADRDGRVVLDWQLLVMSARA